MVKIEGEEKFFLHCNDGCKEVWDIEIDDQVFQDAQMLNMTVKEAVINAKIPCPNCKSSNTQIWARYPVS